MSTILSQIFTLPVQICLIVVAVVLVLLWALSIFWVFRDARQRDTFAIVWAVVAIIPVAGLVAYCLLRPPLTQLDEDEQDMELDLLQRQLDQYGNCPQCGYPVEADFIACPNCSKRLAARCGHCGRVLRPEWKTCPYCATPVGRGKRRSGSQHRAAAAEQQAEGGDPFAPASR